MSEKMPVFVKIDEYKEVLDILSVIKTKLSDAKDVLAEVESLKAKEDAEIESWKESLDDVEEKIHYVNEELFEPSA
ncbi:MAG: hypothetical protein ACMXYK_04450 [Candidatus Woesearchaeota archaeon]